MSNQAFENKLKEKKIRIYDHMHWFSLAFKNRDFEHEWKMECIHSIRYLMIVSSVLCFIVDGTFIKMENLNNLRCVGRGVIDMIKIVLMFLMYWKKGKE